MENVCPVLRIALTTDARSLGGALVTMVLEFRVWKTPLPRPRMPRPMITSRSLASGTDSSITAIPTAATTALTIVAVRFDSRLRTRPPVSEPTVSSTGGKVTVLTAATAAESPCMPWK